jgi:hypothetical protein
MEGGREGKGNRGGLQCPSLGKEVGSRIRMGGTWTMYSSVFG